MFMATPLFTGCEFLQFGFHTARLGIITAQHNTSCHISISISISIINIMPYRITSPVITHHKCVIASQLFSRFASSPYHLQLLDSPHHISPLLFIPLSLFPLSLLYGIDMCGHACVCVGCGCDGVFQIVQRGDERGDVEREREICGTDGRPKWCMLISTSAVLVSASASAASACASDAHDRVCTYLRRRARDRRRRSCGTIA